MDILLEQHLDYIEAPANLRINDLINQFRAKCRSHGCEGEYYHFAFGQSPFPPPPAMVEALAANAEKHSYLPTAGLPQLRECIAAYYQAKFGMDISSEQVIVSPGSKEMIAVILAVVQGAVIVPTPSWVSYLPQAKILKKEVTSIKTRREDGYRLTPQRLRSALQHIYAPQKVLILNYPHNPTGVVYTEEELQALVDVCRAEQVLVVADEIYAQTTFAPKRFTSIQRLYPEGTIVTGGLSKIGPVAAIVLALASFPKSPPQLLADVKKIAGSTYSCVAAPIQYAAIEAYARHAAVKIILPTVGN